MPPEIIMHTTLYQNPQVPSYVADSVSHGAQPSPSVQSPSLLISVPVMFSGF